MFKVWLAGRPYALKCYTRPGKRNGMLYAYLAGRRTPLLCEVRYLPEELYIYGPDGEGAWYDTVLTEWADGDSLGYAVRRALHHRDTERMAALSRGFDAMVAALLSMPWAHGDLKPGNITVGTDGTMRLLDYDACTFPASTRPEHPKRVPRSSTTPPATPPSSRKASTTIPRHSSRSTAHTRRRPFIRRRGRPDGFAAFHSAGALRTPV